MFPIFIVGSARSGTSALNAALRHALQLPAAFEGHLWPLLGEIAALISRRRKETEVMFDGFPGAAILTAPEEVLRATMLRNIVAAFMGHETRWIDKTPGGQMIRCIPLIKEVYPESSIIFMKRHPLDAVDSMTRKFPERSFSNYLSDWTDSQLAWLDLPAVFTQGAATIEYGDLLFRTDIVSDQLQEVLKFGSEEKRRLFNFLMENREIEKTKSKEHAYEMSISTMHWTDGDKKAYLERCGEVARRLGYDSVAEIRYGNPR